MNAFLQFMRPSQMLVRSTRLTVDSVGAIDRAIAEVRAITIDATVVPALAADLADLDRTLAAWDTQLRSLVLDTMTSIVFLDDRLESQWASTPRDDDAAMLSLARSLQAEVAVEASDTAYLQEQLAPFRSGIDRSIARIEADLADVDRELANARDRAQARIRHYETHPWELLWAGLSIFGLISEMNDIIKALGQANKAMTDLERVQAQIAQLSAARGPLLSLSLALVGLSGGISNMTSAIQQLSAALESILANPPLTPILAAQLEAMMQDLARSEEIAHEILDLS